MQLERYRIDSEIGRGAMATVYKVFDTRAERYAALKLLHRRYFEDTAIRARFIQEAKTIAQLRHRAIIPVLHAAQVGEDLFLVMPLMEGGSLADRLQHGALSPVEILAVVERIASALDYAHEQGIVHRDVKPENILFDDSGQAYLGDFGIVKLTESHLTMTGTGLIGTPAYMSPEQIQGAKTLDGRSDTYSLGVVLFEMLSGRIPFDGDSEMAVAMKHVNDPVPDVRQYVRTVASGWQKIIDRAMAKKPEDRFQTGADMVAAIGALLDGKSAGKERKPKAATGSRSGVWPLVAMMAALLVLTGFVIFWLISSDTGTQGAGTTTISPTAAAGAGETEGTEPPTSAATLVVVVITATGDGSLAISADAPSPTPLVIVVTATAEPSPSSTRSAPTVTPGPVESATALPSPGSIRATTNVFTREGPGMAYPVFGSLVRDEIVPVIARDRSGEWYLVRLASGRLVWVSADFVTEPEGEVPLAMTIPAPPSPTATPTSIPAAATATTAGGGPGGGSDGVTATNTPFVIIPNTPFSPYP